MEIKNGKKRGECYYSHGPFRIHPFQRWVENSNMKSGISTVKPKSKIEIEIKHKIQKFKYEIRADSKSVC